MDTGLIRVNTKTPTNGLVTQMPSSSVVRYIRCSNGKGLGALRATNGPLWKWFTSSYVEAYIINTTCDRNQV